MLDELLNRDKQPKIMKSTIIFSKHLLYEQQVVQHFNASTLIAEPENTAAFHGI